MRALGYRTVDALVDWLSDPAQPPITHAEPDELAKRLGGGASEAGEGYEAALTRLFEDVLPYASRGAHPRFFAYVPFAGTWPGALGDFVASAANVYAGSWQEGAGPTQLELEVLGWFKEWVGYPVDAGGTLLSGGSAANLTAIACARETLVGAMRDDLVLYASDQTHSSIARAARILGFRPGQVRVLPVADDLTLEPATLAAAIEVDENAGRRPFLVVANAGATSTGAIDPIGEIAELCRARGLWLHVDAAYGGFAALTERGRTQLGDLSAADSITLDPHKWLFQPYECGSLLVRDAHALRRAFEITSDYLRDSHLDDEAVNFADHGLQLSRMARAFKVWLSVTTFGVAAFRAAIDRALDAAEYARARIADSERFELVAPPSLSVVCFRPKDGADEVVDGLVAALEESGIGLISSTRVHGRAALRLCILAHTSQRKDVAQVLDFLEHAEPVAVGDGYERDAVVSAALPVFTRLGKEVMDALVECAEPRTVPAGTTIVEQWETSRDLFVIADGAADVLVGGRLVATLRAGEHFGEIAALDWGAGFARSRAATVVAREDVRLLVLDSSALAGLVDRFPQIETELRVVANERLRRAR